ncbi:MAG: hypothetical protein Q9200_002782 [Gallowayella weberi]
MAGPPVEDLDEMVFVSDNDDDNQKTNNSTKESAPQSSSYVEPGMIPGIKSFYPGEKDEWGRCIATEKRPEDLPEPEETEESGRYALAIRYNRCYDGRKTLGISSIVVQSPLLKKVLGHVLKGYPCMAPELNRLEFVSPFRPFVHRWQRLTDALDNEQDPTVKSHIQLFYDALKTDLELTLETRDDFVEHKTITFNALWMIFSPGEIVITTCNGRQMAARLVTAFVDQMRNEDVYHLECEMVHTDGEVFGWTKHPYDIQEFGGMRKISDLSVYPLRFHRNVEKITKKLIDNGKAYEKLLGLHHKYYQGLALDGRHHFHVDSRIILDAKSHKWHNPSRVSVEPFKKLKTPKSSDLSAVIDDSESSACSDEDYDPLLSTAEAKKVPVRALTEEQLMLCGSMVKGYSLRNKRWLDFFVDTIQDIEWRENVRDGVVLEEEQTDLIFSMTEGHRQKHNGLQTKGLNILVCGPTGVGKTFTVEAVAESLRAPLLYLTAADVDLDPSDPDLESPFTDLLEMCGRWNAILLYDEANGGLDNDRLDKDNGSENSCKPFTVPAGQKHTPSLANDHRSVLLRALESHSTAFFVTCNAFAEDCMDDRFLSRFHLTFNLPELTAAPREKIWQKCLESHKDTNFFVDCKTLAGWPLNGREIANAVTVAKTLTRDGTIEMKHLEQVVSASKRPVVRESRDDVWGWAATDKKKKKKIKNPAVEDAVEVVVEESGPCGRKKVKEAMVKQNRTEASATTQPVMESEQVMDSSRPSPPSPTTPAVEVEPTGTWDFGNVTKDLPTADDGWGSFKAFATKKITKSKTAAGKEFEESFPEPPPPPPMPEFDDCGDAWGLEKKKKVSKKKTKDATTAEFARDAWVSAENAESEKNGLTDKAIGRMDAPTEGPGSESREPVLPAVEVGDWDFWGTSKKSKKVKKKGPVVWSVEAAVE